MLIEVVYLNKTLSVESCGSSLLDFYNDLPSDLGPCIASVNGEYILRKHWNKCKPAADHSVRFEQVAFGKSARREAEKARRLAEEASRKALEASEAAAAESFEPDTDLNPTVIEPPLTPIRERQVKAVEVSPTYDTKVAINRVSLDSAVPEVFGTYRISPDLLSERTRFLTPTGSFPDYVVSATDFRQYYVMISMGEFNIKDVQFTSSDADYTHTSVGHIAYNQLSHGESFGSSNHTPNYMRDDAIASAGISVTIGADLVTTAATTKLRVHPETPTGESPFVIDFFLFLRFPQGYYYTDSSGNDQNLGFQLDVEFTPINNVTGVETGSAVKHISVNQPYLLKEPHVMQLHTDSLDPHTHYVFQAKVRRPVNSALIGAAVYDTIEYLETGAIQPRGANARTDIGTRLWLRLSELTSKELTNRTLTVLVERKLPTYVVGSAVPGPASAASGKSIPQILLYILHEAGVPAEFIDRDGILNASYSTNAQFNGVLDRKTSLWETLKLVARCGRAMPVLREGVVTVVTDTGGGSISSIYGLHNVLRDSVVLRYKIPSKDQLKNVRITYIDPTTFEKRHYVSTVISAATQVTNVNFFGCTDLGQARDEADYLTRINLYRRKYVTFRTELEGYLPNIGDKIGLDTSLFSNSHSSSIKSVEGTTITLESELELDASKSYVALLQAADGSTGSELAVTPVSSTQLTFSTGLALTIDNNKFTIGSTGGFTGCVILVFEAGKVDTYIVKKVAATHPYTLSLTVVEENNNVY